MGNPSELIHVVVSGCIWALLFGFLLSGFRGNTLHPRRAWLWFIASAVFAGLTMGLLQVFEWRLFHGWLMLIFAASLAGLCVSGIIYRRTGRFSNSSDGSVHSQNYVPPELPDRAELLRSEIEKAINQTGYQKLRNQKRASYIKLAAMFFSSAATVLLGLKDIGAEQVLKNIAFVFSASVTLLTALEPFFNFRSFWVEHEIAQGRFLGLRADLEYYLAGSDPKHPDEPKLAAFHQTYQKIWDDLNAVWAENRRREKI
jgi:hypothetical protein